MVAEHDDERPLRALGDVLRERVCGAPARGVEGHVIEAGFGEARLDRIELEYIPASHADTTQRRGPLRAGDQRRVRLVGPGQQGVEAAGERHQLGRRRRRQRRPQEQPLGERRAPLERRAHLRGHALAKIEAQRVHQHELDRARAVQARDLRGEPRQIEHHRRALVRDTERRMGLGVALREPRCPARDGGGGALRQRSLRCVLDERRVGLDEDALHLGERPGARGRLERVDSLEHRAVVVLRCDLARLVDRRSDRQQRRERHARAVGSMLARVRREHERDGAIARRGREPRQRLSVARIEAAVHRHRRERADDEQQPLLPREARAEELIGERGVHRLGARRARRRRAASGEAGIDRRLHVLGERSPRRAGRARHVDPQPAVREGRVREGIDLGRRRERDGAVERERVRGLAGEHHGADPRRRGRARTSSR